jgi:transcriptional regulator with XRE-family HTH domain
MVEVQADELNGVFCANLRQARIRLGLTQIQLAEKLGVAQSYISDLEAGKKRPLVETLAELADALGTTPAKLITPQLRRKNAG